MSAEPVPQIRLSIRPGLPGNVVEFVRRCLFCSNVEEVRCVGGAALVNLLMGPAPDPTELALWRQQRRQESQRRAAERRKLAMQQRRAVRLRIARAD